MYITRNMLEEAGACDSAIRLFADRFGTRVEPTLDLALSQADDWDWAWAAGALLPLRYAQQWGTLVGPARDETSRAVRAAQEVCPLIQGTGDCDCGPVTNEIYDELRREEARQFVLLWQAAHVHSRHPQPPWGATMSNNRPVNGHVRVGIRQWRVLCELAATPDEWRPIGEIIRHALPLLAAASRSKVAKEVSGSGLVDVVKPDTEDESPCVWRVRINDLGLNAQGDARTLRTLLTKALAARPDLHTSKTIGESP